MASAEAEETNSDFRPPRTTLKRGSKLASRWLLTHFAYLEEREEGRKEGRKSWKDGRKGITERRKGFKERKRGFQGKGGRKEGRV
jgi:hypothetical protein